MRSTAESLQEYGRGLAGGLIFSLPLLYTAEVWDAGLGLPPSRLLIGVSVTFLLLLGYNHYSGLRRDANFVEVLIESVEELGLGLLLAALLLWLFGQIDRGVQPNAIINLVSVEGLLAAIGFSVGTAQLGARSDDVGSAGEEDEHSLLSHLILSACGAVLIAANVAPTEEILQIAGLMAAWQLLIASLISIGLGALVTIYSNFIGTPYTERPTLFAATSEVAVTYAVALLVSLGLLWFFDRVAGQNWPLILARTIVLGVPATLGASAGRLLLRQQ